MTKVCRHEGVRRCITRRVRTKIRQITIIPREFEKIKYSKHFLYLFLGISFFIVFVTINFELTFIEWVQSEFLKDTTADEETGSVGGGVVGQTARDTISWQLMWVGSTDDDVTLEASVGNLGNDVLVCDTDYKSVFWGVVFVLVLNTKTLAGEIVGFTWKIVRDWVKCKNIYKPSRRLRNLTWYRLK